MPLAHLSAVVERRFTALAIIGVLAVHLVSLQSGFVDFDDDTIFLDNPLLTQTDPGVVLPALFDPDRPGAYRPIRDLSHWADRLLHGHTPWLAHLHHLALLALAVAATGAFIRRIGWRGPRALVVLLLAYTHPIQVEVIGWISGRKDLLAAVFFFAALVAFLRFLQRARPLGWAIATAALLALGVMSKGHVIVAPGVLAMLWLHARWRAPETIARRPRAIGALVAALFVAALAVAPRVADEQVVMPEIYRDSARYALTLGDRLQLPLRYAINLVRPTELNHIYLAAPLDGAHTAMTAASALLVALLLALGVRWLVRRDPRAPLLAIVAGLMLPFMHFASGVVYMADRYVFVAMPFVALLVVGTLADALDRRAVPRRLRAALAAAALALCALLSIGEHAAWHDPVALWSRMTRVYPESAWGFDRLGRAYYRVGRYHEAGGAWIAAAEREPGASKHLNNAAVAAMALGRTDAAVGLLRRALAIDPNDGWALDNLRILGAAP